MIETYKVLSGIYDTSVAPEIRIISDISFHTFYSTHSPEICVKLGLIFAAI